MKKEFIIIFGLCYSLGCSILLAETFFAAVNNDDELIIYVNQHNERNVEIILVPIATTLAIIGNSIMLKGIISNLNKTNSEKILSLQKQIMKIKGDIK